MRRRTAPIDPEARPIQLTRCVISDWITNDDPAPLASGHFQGSATEWRMVMAAKRRAEASHIWEAAHGGTSNQIQIAGMPGKT